MPLAICVRCGNAKSGAFEACPLCHFDPAGLDVDKQTQAKAMLLSELESPSEVLGEASRALRAGESWPFDPARVAALMEVLNTQKVPILAPDERRGGTVAWGVWFFPLLAAIALGVGIFLFKRG